MSDDMPILGDFKVIHSVVVVQTQTIDTFTALCTCGEYQSPPSSFTRAKKAGHEHADAKNRPQEPQ